MAWVGEPERVAMIEAEKGDAILFSSLMLRRTPVNLWQSNRWAYVVEYMSLDEFDPYIKPPYFIVAIGGKPCPKFVRIYRGRLNPKDRITYLLPMLGRAVPAVRGPMKKALSKIRRFAGKA